MKHVSRDANVVQLYGAVVKDDTLALISEYMEVS